MCHDKWLFSNDRPESKQQLFNHETVCLHYILQVNGKNSLWALKMMLLQKLVSLHFTSVMKILYKRAHAFLGQVPNPQRLVPRRWYECERPVLREDQVPHNTFVAMEIKHGIT